MCSLKHFVDCVSSIKIDNSECLQQCSGILVTSFEEQEIEDRPLNLVNTLVDKLSKYMSEKLPYDFGQMSKEFQGYCLQVLCNYQLI